MSDGDSSLFSRTLCACPPRGSQKKGEFSWEVSNPLAFGEKLKAAGFDILGETFSMGDGSTPKLTAYPQRQQQEQSR